LSDVDRRYGVLLTIAYDGRAFRGFARQRDVRTVAGELEHAISTIDAGASEVRAASRTDAGVHAHEQVIAFDAARELAPRNWVLGLATRLDRDVAVVRGARVDAGFVPSHRAVSKTYRYVVLESAVRDPFLEQRAWRVEERLNHETMRTEASALCGEHDFVAFRGAADEREDTVRHVLRAEVRTSRCDARCLEIEITGNRFLYRMVRIIVGTLVDVGRARLEPGAVGRAFQSGSRDDLGMTAPPEGLYLDRVELDESGRDPWPA
jgi:tRNA pseudouridine38-40 synthase